MKIAINFENLPEDGGAYHENILLTDVFKSFDNSKYDIHYIVSNKKVEKILKGKNLKTIFFKKNLIFRIQNFLYKFKFFKFILEKFKIQNNYEKFVKNNKIDLLIFNNPSEMSLLAFNLMYVIVFYELQHLKYNFFPEYKAYHNFDLREIIINNFLSNAFKIITCVNKDKVLLEKYYNAQEDKIMIQPFVSRLPLIYEETVNKDDFQNYKKKLNLDTEKKILFYPAQFWPHKNHKYIIDALDELVNRYKKKEYHVVFCGYDKFNQLNFLKNKIKEKQLADYFTFFDYLEDNEIIALYLNCHALVMPTFVGHYSLPLFESFYFKIPAFFTKDLLDDNLRKFAFEIDTKKPDDLATKLMKINSDDKNLDKIMDEAHNFYKNFCSIEKIQQTYKEIFDEVLYFKSIWK